MTSRPDRIFNRAVQQERTALAWERTGVALMVAGALLLKHAIDAQASWAEVVGLLVVVSGAGSLLWSSHRYESLHDLLRSGSNVTRPVILGAVAWTAMVLSAAAVLLLVTGLLP
jgi:putative membrane protein